MHKPQKMQMLKNLGKLGKNLTPSRGFELIYYVKGVFTSKLTD